MVPAYIPSPSQGVWHLGPIPIRAYAFCIILGVLVAVRVSEPRTRARGIRANAISDVAVIAVPIALLGARLYNVITSPQPYFGKGGDPIAVFEVWKGGLGVPGGVLFGVTAGWIWSKRHGIDPYKMADAAGPAIAIGQAIGRFGNYFNQELFGKPTSLPWGLKIDPGHDGYVPGHSVYQPTFLYEVLWDLSNFGVCVWAERHFRLKKGQVMAIYVGFYSVGRFWIEYLRIDSANHLFGLRLNDYVSAVTLIGAIIAFRRLGRRPDLTLPYDGVPTGSDAEVTESSEGATAALAQAAAPVAAERDVGAPL